MPTTANKRRSMHAPPQQGAATNWNSAGTGTRGRRATALSRDRKRKHHAPTPIERPRQTTGHWAWAASSGLGRRSSEEPVAPVAGCLFVQDFRFRSSSQGS